jgi:hypothetical protein
VLLYMGQYQCKALSERMRLWVALMRCPASLRLSIASSRTVSSLAITEVYE